MRTRGARLPLAACLALAALSGCRQETPLVGPPVTKTVALPTVPRIAITGASLNPTTRYVVVTFRVEQDGAGLVPEEVAALEPRWTLAALERDPVTGTPAWKSHLLLGAQTMASLPIDGPGTPPEYVVANARQPGAESGAVEDLGGGDYTYTFATALPLGYDPAATLRVGVFLEGVARATDGTVATHDFVPGGGALSVRDTILDSSCNGCHGMLRTHDGRRATVRLCLTCHTWQNADPDTVDPAAPAPATAATNPNPLDLGRLVHRIHRGKNTPTMFKANSTATALALPSATALPLPFSPSRTTGTTPKNAPVAGARFSFIGERGRERLVGKIETRSDNDQAARTLAAGIVFPRDLRDCDACHAGAPQGAVVTGELFRRTCAGCHPDVWFGDGTATSLPSPDAVHMPHPGGPQVDDTRCGDCHAPAGATPYAPVGLAHSAPFKSPYFNLPVAQILAVSNVSAGQHPEVVLKLTDEDGVIPRLNATTTFQTGATPSPIGRGITPRVTVANLTGSDILWTLSGTTTTNPLAESLVNAATNTSYAIPRQCTPGAADPSCICDVAGAAAPCLSTWSPRTCAPATDTTCTCTAVAPATTCIMQVNAPALPSECTETSPCYRHVFNAAVPSGATGTFAVTLDGRRSLSRTCTPGPSDATCTCTPAAGATTCNIGASKHYVVTTDPLNPVPPAQQFPWPYTGESLSEVMDNPVAWVDSAVGTLGAGNPEPRREIVNLSKCNACHLRLTLHGGRTGLLFCVTCHAPNRTDWSQRNKDASGNVLLSATFDRREETTVHFKVMIHRIHTGEREGPASLAALDPYVVYGNGKSPFFFDEDEFPNDLADCRACHVNESFTFEALPSSLAPTVANETGTIQHAGTAAHVPGEPSVPAITAACMGCHATSYSAYHAVMYTKDGEEQCAKCHKTGTYGVKAVHGLPELTAP